MTYQERADLATRAWKRDRPQLIAVDTETEGTAFFDRAFCATVAWRRPVPQMAFIGEGPGPKNVMQTNGCVVPYSVFKEAKEKAGEIEAHYIEFADDDHRGTLSEMMLGTPQWIFHNSKFDLQKLILAEVIGRQHVTPARIEDTEALAHLQVTERRKGLKFLAELLLGIPNTEEAELKAEMKKHKLKLEEGYHLLPREVLVPYAIQDAVDTLLLYELIRPYIAAYPELEALYADELEITMTLLDMEARGVRVDPAYVSEQLKHYSSLYIKVERAISALVGKPVGKNVKAGEFNPGSSKQLGEYFTAKGIETTEVTKKGQPSYGKAFMSKCTDPLAELITHYRDVEKMKNTYFLAIHEEHRDGILHPNFRQHKTKTGRFSSGEAGEED